MDELKEDNYGVGKKFRLEFLSFGTYKNNIKKLEDAEIESTFITGKLIKYPCSDMEHIHIMDESNCINIIPVSRVVSMIHVSNEKHYFLPQ